MTKRVRMLISRFWPWIYIIGSAQFPCSFFFSFWFPSLLYALTHDLFPVDEQFSDEKQFLIMQIQNL